jgi:hypothetical protein
VGRRFAVHAGAHRQALIAVALLASGTVSAAPKKRAAKAQFNIGVASYKAGDYPTASVAFGKSFTLEGDVETLFAWAQAERKQDHCDKAVELYGKLLAMKLPAANKSAIKVQLEECKGIIADQRAAADAKAAAEAAQAAEAAEASKPQPAPPVVAQEPEPVAVQVPPPIRYEPIPWFKDGLGDTLLVGGIAGVGIGVAMLISGHSAEADANKAATYATFKPLDDKAKSRGTIGVVASSAGIVLILGSLVRYATRSTSRAVLGEGSAQLWTERPVVTGWIDDHAGGVGLAGAF